MEKIQYTVEGKEITLYPADRGDMPLVVLNNFSGDGASVVEALDGLGRAEVNLLCVGNLLWDHDMVPWDCPPLSPEDTPCTGGADAYLRLLTEEILPGATERVKGTPAWLGLAGYSLAGLFALYACYRCDRFDRVASMSGSLWFPGFKDYVLGHEMKRRPDRLYISLGDAEAKTRQPLLRTVRDHTEAIVAHYEEQGLPVTWELNPGNHFRDAALRSAKGIAAIL